MHSASMQEERKGAEFFFCRQIRDTASLALSSCARALLLLLRSLHCFLYTKKNALLLLLLLLAFCFVGAAVRNKKCYNESKKQWKAQSALEARRGPTGMIILRNMYYKFTNCLLLKFDCSIHLFTHRLPGGFASPPLPPKGKKYKNHTETTYIAIAQWSMIQAHPPSSLSLLTTNVTSTMTCCLTYRQLYESQVYPRLPAPSNPLLR